MLVVHDTTEFTFPGEVERTGLSEKADSYSFYGHYALALAETEAPVVHGIVGQRAYVVIDSIWNEVDEDDQLQPLLTRQERWELLAADVRQQAPADLDLIHVMDREADDYELFTKIREQGDHFVIRVRHDRRLASKGKLLAALTDEPLHIAREVMLSRRGRRRLPNTRKNHPDRDRRAATLRIRAGTVEIVRPDGVAPLGQPTMRLSVVEVLETDPPQGEQAVHWLILSSLPIETEANICRIVDIYRKRWTIEEFFKSLKTGCAAEKRQARSRHSLLNTVALLVPIAWRLLVVRATERFAPKSPADSVVDAVELAALRQLVPKAKLPKRPTAHQVLLAIAMVGGHLKHNGKPGWLVLGRGMEDLMRFAAGFRAALVLQGQTGASEM